MADMTPITKGMYLSNKAPTTKTTGSGELGKDAFLKNPYDTTAKSGSN